MKKLYLPLCLLLLLMGCTPKADFQDINGKDYRYQDFQGEWLVINYWAAWCKPCIKEIPELNALHQHSDDITVMGIHYDKPALEKQQQDAQQLKIAFPVALANLHQHYGYDFPNVLPTTVIINPQGKVEQYLLGPQTSEELLKLLK